jgi:hypothetical protein
MGNGSHASFYGVGMIDLKFTSEKIVQHASCPFYQQESCEWLPST